MPVLDTPSALHVLAGCSSVHALNVAKLHLQRGHCPNQRNKDGLTPVHVAAIWGSYDLLELLLLHGGDVSLTDDDGLNALQHAQRAQQHDCAHLITRHAQQMAFTNTDHVHNTTNTARVLVPLNLHNADQSQGCVSEDLSDVQGPQAVPRYEQWFAPKPKSRSPWTCWLPKSTSNRGDDLSPPYVKKTPTSTVQTENEHSDNTSFQCCSYNASTVFDTAFNKSPDASVSQTTTSTLTEQNSNEHNMADNTNMSEDSFVSLLNATLQMEDSTTDYMSATDMAHQWIDEQTLHGTRDVLNEALLLQCTAMPDATLRLQLTHRGVSVGPLCAGTRRLYARRLAQLMRDEEEDSQLAAVAVNDRKYSRELCAVLGNENGLEELLAVAAADERLMIDAFDQPNRVWREGPLKMSFCYLLLDPRVVETLLETKHSLQETEQLRQFVNGIFYIGKGKKSRPYQHLIQAAECYDQKSASDKLARIQQIWDCGRGVVSVHVFQNVLAAEAFTREAAMIDAILLDNLCNKRKGDYYGVCSGWSVTRRRRLGVYLLRTAMRVLFLEGNRELRRLDILDISQ